MAEVPSYIFVALPPLTESGNVLFGKNANRPAKEVTEIRYFPAENHEDSKVMCTYIEVEQVHHTHAVILSKPAWMWGAEMGANEHGVCIGNTAIPIKGSGTGGEKECLLGTDLVRLGLERSETAAEAVNVITLLLGEHGQGGPYSEEPGFTHSTAHQNSFLIADGSEAWVLEIAASFWAAERVTDGLRSLHGRLTIETKFDLSSPDLVASASAAGFYQESEGPFSFSKVFFHDDQDQQSVSSSVEEKLIQSGCIGIRQLQALLRNEQDGICLSSGDYVTTGSQVSLLRLQNCSPSGGLCCHWFTGTPDPKTSMFKPFIFSSESQQDPLTASPEFDSSVDPAKTKPRFQTQVDRMHKLYRGHERLVTWLRDENPLGTSCMETIRMLENTCLEDMEDTLEVIQKLNPKKLADTFSHIVMLENNFYK